MVLLSMCEELHALKCFKGFVKRAVNGGGQFYNESSKQIFSSLCDEPQSPLLTQLQVLQLH